MRKQNLLTRKPFVGVDSNTEKSRIGVDQESDVTLRQVVDNRSLRKICHVSQILQKF